MVALAAAMLAHEARAQEVRGRVTDAEGRAVEPATVAVFRGDRQLAADVTDTAGRFRLAAPDEPYTLRVRHVAYRPLDTLISVRGHSGDELSLVMAEAPGFREIIHFMKIAPLSGFPEWLPEDRLVEQRILDSLRSTFELHGFSGIETRAVEPLDQLLRKGETSKEVYVLDRLQGEEGGESRLGLHFDLTVPLARYVLEHAGRIDFPFKRYQIQRVWRGERPQDGRFREFTQADVDIVGADSLAFHHEIELPLVMVDALGRLPIPRVRVKASNRKVAQGFYEAVGVEDVAQTLRVVDKLDKIGPPAVRDLRIDMEEISRTHDVTPVGLRKAPSLLVRFSRGDDFWHQMITFTHTLDQERLTAALGGTPVDHPGKEHH